MPNYFGIQKKNISGNGENFMNNVSNLNEIFLDLNANRNIFVQSVFLKVTNRYQFFM